MENLRYKEIYADFFQRKLTRLSWSALGTDRYASGRDI